MENKRLLDTIKNSMSGLLPVHTVENVAPKICERLEAEGVIMPPCKVGDIVYVEYHGEIKTGTVLEGHFYLQSADTLTVCIKDGTYKEYYIDDVFLTKEEAEEALKGGEQE